MSVPNTPLTDQERARVAEAHDWAGWGELEADEVPLFATSSDTLEAMLEAREGWAEQGYLERVDDHSVQISRAQAIKGQPRRDLLIVEVSTGVVVFG